jgi:putative CRISPR-associated protein (TIGR02619 family)
MFTALPELREGPVDDAAARLKSVFDPSRGGAEHESIAWYLRDRDRLAPRLLHLIASDTDDGERAARILAGRFGRDFARTDWSRCKDLRDDDPRRFVTRGLRRLVNELVGRVERLRREGFVPVIDATGGYKPQIAYAALVGQVTQVPVHYRYQGFPEVMALEPLPVSVDVQVWFDHLWFFDRLRVDLRPANEIPAPDPRVPPLIEREDRLVMLSPLGELMEAAVDRLIEGAGDALVPRASGIAPDEKKVVYEDANPGRHRGLEDFCDRVRQLPYVTRIAARYYNPDLPRQSGVRLDPEGALDRLEVWYGDGRALSKLRVWTTARDAKELSAARAHVARELGLEPAYGE